MIGHGPAFLYPADTPTEGPAAEMAASIDKGQPWAGRIACRHKGGRPVTTETTVYPIVDAEGEISNFVRIKRDVTLEDDLQRQLLQAQKMQAIGRFGRWYRPRF